VSQEQPKPEKPTLTLVPAREIGVDQLLKLFRQLTGREPTAEDREQARLILEKQDGERKGG
jgi:hypothetical protein